MDNIRVLYNFLESSHQRQPLFSDIESENEGYTQTLKSLNETRLSCRWELVKTDYCQIERTVKAFFNLSSDNDAKTYSGSKTILIAVCDGFRMWTVRAESHPHQHT